MRYYIIEQGISRRRICIKKELYNLKYLKLRIKVEIGIGIIKRRWKIVRDLILEYDIEIQRDIVYAVIALYNWITIKDPGAPLPDDSDDDYSDNNNDIDKKEEGSSNNSSSINNFINE